MLLDEGSDVHEDAPLSFILWNRAQFRADGEERGWTRLRNIAQFELQMGIGTVRETSIEQCQNSCPKGAL